MKRRKEKPTSIVIVICPTGKDSSDWDPGYQRAAHIALLPARQLAKGLEKLLYWLYDAKINDLTIVGLGKGRIDLQPILEQVVPRLTEDASLYLESLFVSQSLFDLAVSHWQSVHLARCALGRGWQRRPHAPRKCTDLWFRDCLGDQGQVRGLGQASWPELKCIDIEVDTWVSELHSKYSHRPDEEPKFQGNYVQIHESLLRAFWNPGIETLWLYPWPDSEALSRLPRMPSLIGLYLGSTPISEESLRWITSQPRLADLDLSWRAGEHFDWTLLRNLKPLRNLEISARCTDEELKSILQNSRLTSAVLNGDGVSPASWPAILSSSLREIRIGSDLIEGEAPYDLIPPSTKLKSVLAINVARRHMINLKLLAERYGTIKVNCDFAGDYEPGFLETPVAELKPEPEHGCYVAFRGGSYFGVTVDEPHAQEDGD